MNNNNTIGFTVFFTQELNLFIQTLYKEAQIKPIKAFKPWVFDYLQQLLPFDSGLWITSSTDEWLEDPFLYHQPDSLIQNIAKPIPNRYIGELQTEVENTHREYLPMSCQAYPAKDTYDQGICQTYGIEQALVAQVKPEGYSGTVCELHFFRRNPDDCFTREQVQLLAFILPSLIEAARVNVLGPFKSSSEDRTENKTQMLSNRQKEVCHLLEAGLTDKAIGKKLGISHHTVSNHLKSIYKLLNVQSRPAAIASLSKQVLLR